MRELEEERRLFYVALTRAERHCVLTSAKNRWRYGKMEFANPSRFLREIDPLLVEVIGEGSEASSLSPWESQRRATRSLFGEDTPRFRTPDLWPRSLWPIVKRKLRVTTLSLCARCLLLLRPSLETMETLFAP